MCQGCRASCRPRAGGGAQARAARGLGGSQGALARGKERRVKRLSVCVCMRGEAAAESVGRLQCCRCLSTVHRGFAAAGCRRGRRGEVRTERVREMRERRWAACYRTRRATGASEKARARGFGCPQLATTGASKCSRMECIRREVTAEGDLGLAAGHGGRCPCRRHHWQGRMTHRWAECPAAQEAARPGEALLPPWRPPWQASSQTAGPAARQRLLRQQTRHCRQACLLAVPPLLPWLPCAPAPSAPPSTALPSGRGSRAGA